MAKKLSTAERIRRRVLATPGIAAAEVAQALGIPKNQVHVIMWKMRKAGLIPPTERTGKGGGKNKAAPKMAKPKLVFAATSYTSVADKINAPQAAEDLVNHPSHYKVGGIETIDFIEAKLSPAEFVGYLKGSILKYGSRVGHKGTPDLDAGKLAWYAERLASCLKRAA